MVRSSVGWVWVLFVGASALRPPTVLRRLPAQRALGARAPAEALPRQRRRAKLWPFVSSACALGTRPLRARAMNLAVSLDQPLVKSRGGLSALARAASGALVPLLALALALRLVRTVARALIDDEYFEDEDDDASEEEEEEEGEEYADAEDDGGGGSLGLGSFSLRGFFANTVAGVRAVFDELFPLDVEWLPETEWTTVSLAGSTDLGAGFMRYRFAYPSGEDQMPLEASEMFRSLRGRRPTARARARNPNLRSRGPSPARAARTDRSAALAVGIRGKQVLQGQLRAGLVARSARPFRNHHELVGAVGTPGRVAKQHVGRHQFRRLHREHGHRPGNRGEAGQHQVRVRGPSRNHAFSLLRRRGARADAPPFRRIRHVTALARTANALARGTVGGRARAAAGQRSPA